MEALPEVPEVSDLSYRGEACQHLDLNLVGLEVKAVLQITEARRADPLTSTSLTSRAEVYTQEL